MLTNLESTFIFRYQNVIGGYAQQVHFVERSYFSNFLIKDETNRQIVAVAEADMLGGNVEGND